MMAARADVGTWAGRFDRSKLPLVADVLAVGIAVALPWSTSAVEIFAVLWLIAVAQTLDWAEVGRTLWTPAGGLPVLLCALALIGMAWAFGVPFKERFGGFSSFYKLLFIPLLLVHFQRSERAGWVIVGYLVSCSALLLVSWISLAAWVFFNKFILSIRAPGTVVKDHITQGGEFGACALFLAPLAWFAWRDGERRRAIAILALALGFVANLVYIGTSRTGLVTTAALIVLFGWRFLNNKARLGLVLAVIAAGAVTWPLTGNLRHTVTGVVHELRTYDPNGAGNRSSERLVYWQKSISFVSAAPLIGHGTGSILDQFRRSAEGQTGASADVSANPHNQTFAVAIQLGFVGVALLFAMWAAHLLLFRGEGLAAWFGLVVVVQNIIGSLFNSHLFDFTQGWSYVLGIGVAGGVMLKQAYRAAPGSP